MGLVLIAQPDQLERDEPCFGRDLHVIAEHRRPSDFLGDLYGDVDCSRRDDVDLDARPDVPKQHGTDPIEGGNRCRYSSVVTK